MNHTEGPDWDRLAEARDIAHECAAYRAKIERMQLQLERANRIIGWMMPYMLIRLTHTVAKTH